MWRGSWNVVVGAGVAVEVPVERSAEGGDGAPWGGVVVLDAREALAGVGPAGEDGDEARGVDEARGHGDATAVARDEGLGGNLVERMGDGGGVIAQGKDGHVEAVVSLLAPFEHALELAFIGEGGIGLGEVDRVDLRAGDAGVLGDEAFDHVESAWPVGGLLDEPEVRLVPGEVSQGRVVHEAAVDGFEQGVAADGEVERSELRGAGVGLLEEIGGEGSDGFVGGACDERPSPQGGGSRLGLKVKDLVHDGVLSRARRAKASGRERRMRPEILRMIDANANRAGEGLRTLEDIARFALNDAGLSADLKGVRHALRASVEAMAGCGACLMACRDTPGDVGTLKGGVAGDAARREGERADLLSVSVSAGSRAQEAMRVLEELCKIEGGARWRAIEGQRYRTYELSRRVSLALSGARARQWSLCVLISEHLCVHHSWEHVSREAILGGAGCLQLREKALEGRELVARTGALVAMARAYGASVIVNDRVDVALAGGADGVHLGRGDLSVRDARAIAGSSLLVGVSCSTIEQAREGAGEGADYLGLGPMFASTTKPRERLAGVALVRDVCADEAAGRLAHLAISGIHGGNVHLLREAGCRGVAVSSAVCSSADPRSACEAIVAGLCAGGRGLISDDGGGDASIERDT